MVAVVSNRDQLPVVKYEKRCDVEQSYCCCRAWLLVVFLPNHVMRSHFRPRRGVPAATTHQPSVQRWDERIQVA